ncbi:MAG: FKBP-type peptidyl-prolyl cis-trans isomerase [Gammaproteobacteria bacterium]|jgi:FKBP-type peptidyl-prolyl cis-trans isomerase
MTARAILLLLTILLTIPGVAMSAGGGFTMTPGGVRYQDLQTGSGPVAEKGDVATIHFRGWLAQAGTRGKPFLDSRREGQPVRFVVGTDLVMPGWNEAVTGMRSGGRRLARIPSALAYGDRGLSGVVPPGSDLIFEIDLLAVEKAASP